MADLIDLSFLIILLAIMGFMVKDTFYFSRKISIPYELRDKDDKLFANVSIAILILSATFFCISYYYIANPDAIVNLLKSFVDGLERMVGSGAVSENSANDILEKVFLGLYFLVWATLIYLIGFLIVFVIGVAAIFFDNNAVEITFNKKLNEETELKLTYRRIISESSEFLYVENLKDFRIYEGLKKCDIAKITKTYTKTRIDIFIQELCVKIFSENSEIALFLLNKRYRGALIIVLLFVVMILVYLSTYIGVSSNIFLIYFIGIIPVIILMFIDNALR
jgi:hypothetical protein